ncbi:MAG: peptidoglycan recognition family protein [Candidatus Scalinduaceae bacterium]
MKIKERHIIVFSIGMFAIALWLFISLPFIGTNRRHTVTVDIEELCKVDIDKVEWKYIVLHHSATNEGNAHTFDRYHTEKRKWSNGLAYHFVIGNGTRSGDGEIEVGSRWKKQIHGAHTANIELNRVSIGICLVGNFEDSNEPTYNQFESLVSLVNYLSNRYNIPKSNIIRHNQVAQKNTACPGKHFHYQDLIKRLTTLQSTQMHKEL